MKMVTTEITKTNHETALANLLQTLGAFLQTFDAIFNKHSKRYMQYTTHISAEIRVHVYQTCILVITNKAKASLLAQAEYLLKNVKINDRVFKVLETLLVQITTKA